MNHRTCILTVLCIGVLASAARADIMRWFWEVEVNGAAADTSGPIVVGAGDQVDIELWASMDPGLEAFASAAFALRFGDTLLSIGELNVDPDQGNGLSPAFLAFGKNGALADSTGDGIADVIDDIEAWQFSKSFGEPFYDNSNPVKVYSLDWSVAVAPLAPIVFRHTPTLDGDYESRVYTDIFGDSRVYSNTSDQLVFVPAPQSLWAAGLLVLGVTRRTR